MNSLKLNPTKNNFETKIFWLNANVKKIYNKFTMDCNLYQFWFLRINFIDKIGNKIKNNRYSKFLKIFFIYKENLFITIPIPTDFSIFFFTHKRKEK